MKNFQVILLCLVILLNPNFIFSQGLERWIKLNESNVYNFLRNLTGADVSKKLHSQGINMYVSNHNYMKSDLFVTSSFMVTFDSGIPVQFGESLWIKDKINRKGQYDNENLLKNILLSFASFEINCFPILPAPPINKIFLSFIFKIFDSIF